MKGEAKKQLDNNGRDRENKRDRKEVLELNTAHRTAPRNQGKTGQGNTQGARTKDKAGS